MVLNIVSNGSKNGLNWLVKFKKMLKSQCHKRKTVQQQRLGFMYGEIQVPDDFENMAADEIAIQFAGKDH